MSAVQVLAVGVNPNVAFYAWRLHETKSVEVTVVNSTLSNSTIYWTSSSFGDNIGYKPQQCYRSVAEIPRKSSVSYDIIVLSSPSLQDFQKLCSSFAPYMRDDSIILIESTGFVNLEPFVQLCFPKKSNLCIMSIMNESDVRQVGNNRYLHTIRNSDTRIYFGTSLGSNRINANPNFQRMYKLLQTIQKDSANNISLLKSLNPKEFMTYQWKMAIPRIIFNPLSIIFEFEFPQMLESQILCKPLVTGIINELFKIIKKMDCKLVKGFENEENLLKNWTSLFPKTSNNSEYINSNNLFYNFYKNYDLDVDLLLLQPILLADDHGIRTPYLENLYSTMCQYAKLNNGSSLFFARKGGDQDKLETIGQLDEEIKKRTAQKSSLDSTIRESENKKAQHENAIVALSVQIHDKETYLASLLSKQEQKLKQLEGQYNQKFKDLDDQYQRQYEQNQQRLQEKPLPERNDSSNPVNGNSSGNVHGNGNGNSNNNNNNGGSGNGNTNGNSNSNGVVNGPVNRNSSPSGTDSLTDLTDIALYGAAINNESSNQQQYAPYASGDANGNVQLVNGDLPKHLLDKEMELRRREQEILRRESLAGDHNYQQQQQQQLYVDTQFGPQQQYAQQQYVQKYNQYNNVPNGYQQSPIDQQPPHGLPPNGMPQNALPPNLRSNSMMSTRYQQPPQPNGYYNAPPRRVSSIPNNVNGYFEGGYQPQQYPQQQQYYPQQQSSFNNAAPIDPMLESRFKAKKQNRRSQMPLGTGSMSGNLDGLDMGGRGGMPMPGAQKNRPMGPPGNYRRSTGPVNTLNGQFNNLAVNNTGGSMPMNQHPSQNYLQPPLLHGSNASSNSSTNSNDTPKTHSSNDNVNINESVSLSVPAADTSAKPLGGISQSNRRSLTDRSSKKKGGIFGKKG
ncbi:hypothetical protein G9P44_001162 [Scheffersomyces stipitis]|nr:hypothetical protein G9P44_001162 [Scheffersomyces stipitis]